MCVEEFQQPLSGDRFVGAVGGAAFHDGEGVGLGVRAEPPQGDCPGLPWYECLFLGAGVGRHPWPGGEELA